MNLHDIYQKFLHNEEWFHRFLEEEFRKTPPPFYLSCDLRHSGRKVAVVDTNLFPAGFNNLCKVYTAQAVQTFQNLIRKNHPQARKLLVFCEAHTRNKFYFENLMRLQDILTQAGMDVRVGVSNSDLAEDPFSINLSDDRTLLIHRLKKEGDRVFLSDGWSPDLIVSNNDFSSGPDPLLTGIAQPILPPMELGWWRRRKDQHFSLYNKIAEEVAHHIDLDPWLFTCLHTHVEGADLGDAATVERLAQTVDQTLESIRKKYSQYQIDSTPYVFVKNNAGTYGMGVAYFTSGEEILSMNRKVRNKLLSSKGGSRASSFLIQEGIVTADFYSGYPIEPVIYLGGSTPIGGFFRLNEEKDEWSSLNTKGMAFSCLCLHKLDQPHEEPFLRCVEKQTLIKLSFFLAQLAALAAARETA